MSTHDLRVTTVLLALAVGMGAALANGPKLGKPIDPGDIAAWDISIQPDGTGLPRAAARRHEVRPSIRKNVPSAMATTGEAGARPRW